MAQKVTILIADRNPNVREFLKREMVSENFRVLCAEDANTMLKLAFEPFQVDILIIDPDLPDMEPSDVLEKLHQRVPPLPVIIHCLPEESEKFHLLKSELFIEKGGNSIEVIKRSLRERVMARSV